MTSAELPGDSQPAQPDRPPTPVPGGESPPGIASATRPGTVTAASVLWIVLGSLLSLGAVGQLGAPAGVDIPFGAVALVLALGVLLIVLGVRLRRGSDTRVGLTIVGALLSLGLWPALLTVPAIVLQFRPSSKAWFDSRRSAPQS